MEGLMLKLELRYFDHLMGRIDFLGKKKKKPWCWERLKAGGEVDDRGWDGWMASPTRWTWVWASSRSWWWTGKSGVLWSMGSQRVGQDLETELNWNEEYILEKFKKNVHAKLNLEFQKQSARPWHFLTIPQFYFLYWLHSPFDSLHVVAKLLPGNWGLSDP